MANSGDEKFIHFVPQSAAGPDALQTPRDSVSKCVASLQVHVTNAKAIPSQKKVDLYLVAAHWLLIFRKALIVTQGLQARPKFANGQYGSYPTCLGAQSLEIERLRNSAKEVLSTIQSLNNLLMTVRMERIGVRFEDKDATHRYGQLKDEWTTLAVGWISLEDMKKTSSRICYMSVFS